MSFVSKDPNEVVKEIERLTTLEQENILGLCEAELAVQAAKLVEERARLALERTQKDKGHAFSWLNALSMEARAGVIRDAAKEIAREQAAGRKN